MVTDYRAIMIAVLRGQTYATIQESFRCSSKTIRCVKRVVEDHGLTESDVQGLDAERLAGLFPDRRFERDASYAEIDTAALIRRKRIFAAKNPGRKFKIKVEHERYERECLSKGLKPYSYKQYAARVADYISDKNLSWPMTHDPGHKMFVDWSGDKMWVGQPGDTDAFQVSVFVATLPHSGMVFAKCYANERTPNWIAAHVDACDYFGGVPVLFVPDNASTASFRPKKEDPAREINTAYRQFGDYYGAGILPTKPAQPTHKGHVEKHVDIIQDWLGQYLAPYVFDTLDDLNAAVAEQVDWINHHKTPYRGVDGLTRYQEFCDYEQQTLKPLPAIAYEPVEWRWATPRPNCHFQVDKRFYSIPQAWVGMRLRIGLGKDSVKVYDPNGVKLIYVHQRSYKRPGSYTSVRDHQPDSTMTDGKLWTRSRYETWSRHIGPSTYKAITVMLDREKFPTQAFLTCENTLHLASRYSRQELEEACTIVLGDKQFISYSSIKRAISARTKQPTVTVAPTLTPHDDHATESIQTVTSFDDAALRGFDAFDIATPHVRNVFFEAAW